MAGDTLKELSAESQKIDENLSPEKFCIPNSRANHHLLTNTMTPNEPVQAKLVKLSRC